MHDETTEATTPATHDEPGQVISALDGIPESAAPRDVEDLAPAAPTGDEPTDPALTAPDGVPEEGQPLSGSES